MIPLTARRTFATLLVLSMALTALIAVSLAIGSERIPPGDILAALISRLRAGTSALSPEQDVILFSLRLPRIGLAAGVGAVLAVAGASFQALLRNPLADPYILGVSGGAALGSILGIMFAGDMVYGRPLMSFAGAAVASFVVYRLGRRDDDPARLVLAGVVISTFLSSVIALVISLAEDVKLRNITLWLLGDLSSGTIGGLAFVLSAAVVGVAVLLTQARALNLMMVGERDALHARRGRRATSAMDGVPATCILSGCRSLCRRCDRLCRTRCAAPGPARVGCGQPSRYSCICARGSVSRSSCGYGCACCYRSERASDRCDYGNCGRTDIHFSAFERKELASCISRRRKPRNTRKEERNIRN